MSAGIFDGIVVTTSGLNLAARDKVFSLVQKHGGATTPRLNAGRVNVLITDRIQCSDGLLRPSAEEASKKTQIARAHGLPIVSDQWVYDSVSAGRRLPCVSYYSPPLTIAVSPTSNFNKESADAIEASLRALGARRATSLEGGATAYQPNFLIASYRTDVTAGEASAACVPVASVLWLQKCANSGEIRPLSTPIDIPPGSAVGQPDFVNAARYKKISVCFTGFAEASTAKAIQISALRCLTGPSQSVISSALTTEVTHLIVAEGTRVEDSQKLRALLSDSKGIVEFRQKLHVVSTAWLCAAYRSWNWVPEADFVFKSEELPDDVGSTAISGVLPVAGESRDPYTFPLMSGSPARRPTKDPVVMLCDAAGEKDAITKQLEDLGCRVVDTFSPEVTHLVACGESLRRTDKLLCAMAAGIHVVRRSWVTSGAAGDKSDRRENYHSWASAAGSHNLAPSRIALFQRQRSIRGPRLFAHCVVVLADDLSHRSRYERIMKAGGATLAAIEDCSDPEDLVRMHTDADNSVEQRFIVISDGDAKSRSLSLWRAAGWEVVTARYIVDQIAVG